MNARLGVLLFCVFFAACAHLPSTPSPMPRWYAGVAVSDVSPAAGAFIAGHDRNRRFTGTRDPIYAKATVVSDGQQALAIVVIDNIGLTYPDVLAIRQAAAALINNAALPAGRIVVSSTHTHNGPDVVGLWGEHELSSGRDAVYMAALTDKAADTIARAYASLQPVSIHAGTAEPDIPWVINESEPGLLDPTTTVLQFRTLQNDVLANWVHFACHPTTTDGTLEEVSSDYVGGLYRALNAATGGETLFLQGAIGGWVQPVKGDRSWQLADRYGQDVAAAVMQIVAHNMQQIEPRPLQFALQPLSLPLQNPGFSALLEAGVLQRDLIEGMLTSEVAWFTIGDVAFATHPGESSPAYSLATRELLDAKFSVVMGLTQDALGYILKPDYFAHPERYPHAPYLTATSVGPETAPRMMQALTQLIQNRINDQTEQNDVN